MSFGPLLVFTQTIASGASTCSFLLDKCYSKVYAEVSTMSTAAAFDVFASVDGTTYRPVFERVNTAPVQYQTLSVASGVGANGGFAPIDVGYKGIQLRASAVVSGGVTVRLHCSD